MKNLIYLFSLFFLFSCKLEKDHTVGEYSMILNSKEVNGTDIFIARGNEMIILNNHMVGLDYGANDFFYDMDLLSGDKFMRFGERGVGPEDFISPFTLQFINDSIFGIYDLTKRCYFYCNQKDKSIPKSVLFEVSSFHMVSTKYEQYIGLGPYMNGMLCLFDSTGNMIDNYFQYPYRDKDEEKIPNHLRGMAYQGYIKTNPDRDMLVYTCSLGNIIHFYSIKENSIDLLRKIECIYPDYLTEESDGGFGSPIKSKSLVGYISVTTSNNFIYTLFSNKEINDFIKDNKTYEGEYIVIYNWQGEKIDTYKLDIPCINICIHPNEKEIWAITNDPDPKFVIFNLP